MRPKTEKKPTTRRVASMCDRIEKHLMHYSSSGDGVRIAKKEEKVDVFGYNF
jgi:hypothetical protein